MKDALVALGWYSAALLALFGLYALVRWARHSSRKASAIAGSLLLFFGFGLAPDAPQQRIEEAREDTSKKGAESGDPPNP